MMSSGIHEAMRRLQEAHNLRSRGANSELIMVKLGEAKEAIDLEILKLNKKRMQFDRDPNPLPLKHQIVAISMLEKELGVPPTNNQGHEHLSSLLDIKGIQENMPHSIRTRMAVPNLDSIVGLLGNTPYGRELRRGSEYMDFGQSQYFPQPRPQYFSQPQPQYFSQPRQTTTEYEVDF